MKILITAATDIELNPIKESIIKLQDFYPHLSKFKFNFLNTGLGIPSTIFALMDCIGNQRFDFCFNIGIAGSFDGDLMIGETCFVQSDFFGDLSAEFSDGSTNDFFELGFIDPNLYPFTNKIMINPINIFDFNIKKVHGSTVQKVHGSKASIESFKFKYPNIEIETMESAAIFYVCLQKQIPFLCFRSISNYIEPRNKDNWNIPLAINNLQHFIENFLINEFTILTQSMENSSH